MKVQVLLAFFMLSISSFAQTSIFNADQDSATVFKQLDMQFGAALDTVVVVRFQINEEGEATNGEVVRVYCKSCAESVIKKAKEQALDELETVEGTANQKKSGEYYLLPVNYSDKKYIKQKPKAK